MDLYMSVKDMVLHPNGNLVNKNQEHQIDGPFYWGFDQSLPNHDDISATLHCESVNPRLYATYISGIPYVDDSSASSEFVLYSYSTSCSIRSFTNEA